MQGDPATLTTRIAPLVRDAGTTGDVEDRARVLRTEISVSGLAAEVMLELAMCFHPPSSAPTTW
ncbi:hypothetical protein ACWGI0_06285 [Streptomyces sp. NPDC054802]